MLKSGQRVLVAGGPGVVEAVERIGAIVAGRTDDGSSQDTQDISDANIDAVIVGFHKTFNFESMRRASAAVRAGALLIGTNDDATYPTSTGVIPGGGSILAGIATASGVSPIVAGKPNAPMGELVRRELKLSNLDSCWMIGDRYSTDGAFAKTIGAKFALALSGVVDQDEADELRAKHKFELVVKDLMGLAKHLGIAN